jgi:hypothetical protein
MPGPGVGDIILQAAQGIVAMHQGQQRLQLQMRQLDQQEQAQLDAQKAREDGIKLREQNAKLQEDQLALSRERLDQQSKQFEASQKQQASQFDERLKVSQFNAFTNWKNALTNASDKSGKVDLQKALVEFEKLQGSVQAQKSVETDRVQRRWNELTEEVKDLRFASAQEKYLTETDDPNARGIFSTLRGPHELRTEFDKAIQEQVKLQGLSLQGQEHPGLKGAKARVRMFQDISDYMIQQKVYAPPSEMEIRQHGYSQGLTDEQLIPKAPPRPAADAATQDHVDPSSAVRLIDTGVNTGNWDAFIDNSVLTYDADGNIDQESVTVMFDAITANVPPDKREDAYASFTARIQERNQSD